MRSSSSRRVVVFILRRARHDVFGAGSAGSQHWEALDPQRGTFMEDFSGGLQAVGAFEGRYNTPPDCVALPIVNVRQMRRHTERSFVEKCIT